MPIKKQQGPKQVVVCTRVPEKVKEALESMAHQKGVNMGEFLRWHLMDLVSPDMTQQLQELELRILALKMQIEQEHRKQKK